MQVFISDVHLTDGSSGETINAGALKVFAENLRTLVASVREKSAVVTELQIVLLGDIFDVIRSAKWLEAGVSVRPWSPASPEQEAFVLRIVNDIVRQNAGTLAHLNGLRDFAKGQNVPFKLVYVMGNHDWLINRYASCRKAIAGALGMEAPAEGFPLELFDPAYKTFATHGDRYDSFNYMGHRDGSSIGDAIVIELLNRFPIMVRGGLDALVAAGKLKDEERQEIVKQLKELDNIRPLLDAPSWVLKVLKETRNQGARTVILEAWKKCADEFFKVPFIQKMDVPFWPDKIDLLQVLLKVVSHGSMPMVEEVAGKLKKLFFMSGEEGDYNKKACAEHLLRSGDASFVLYGHTHDHVIMPLDQVQTDSAGIVDKIYFNTGTWRQTWNKAILDPAQREFIGWKVLTYIAFYDKDENADYSFEVWNGALG